MRNITGIVLKFVLWWRQMKFRRQHIALVPALCMWLATVVIAGSAPAFPGERDGFEGLKWGAPVQRMDSLRYVGEDNTGLSLHERAGNELVFSAVRNLRRSNTVSAMAVLRL